MSTDPDGDARPPQPGRSRLWRLATPMALGVCGVLVVTSAANSDGVDLRPGRYTDLASVVGAENREVRDLQARARELADEVEELGRAGDDGSGAAYRRASDAARDPAGLEPRSGAGLEVTLSDASSETFETSEEDPNLLVVHQQDIQAVVNALWRGGAEAVTIQGRRIVSTTGIKCAGSSVQLQGVTYPQPYVIGAVGDPAELVGSLADDDYLDRFRRDAENPEIGVGYDVDLSERLSAPAYDGLLDLRYAEPTGS